MALQLNDATAIINRTSGLVSAASDYSCCFWYQPTFQSTAPDYISPISITNAGYTAWTGIYSNPLLSNGDHVFNASAGGPEVSSAGTNIPSSTKTHLGYVRVGTTHRFYRNGVLIGSVTLDVSAVTFTEMLLGNDRLSVVTAPILIWDFKEWNAEKTALTMRAEMAAYGSVVTSSNLFTFTSLASNLLDTSGNGHHWGAAGNYSFVSNPSLPTNISAATATNITSLPYTDSYDTFNLPIWYKRTAEGDEKYIGVWGFGGLGDYAPSLYVWTGSGTTEWPNASFQTIAVNVPAETPQVSGSTYYYEFRSDFSGVGGTLDVSFLPEPDDPLPQGAFLVTDESQGYGASVISETDGHVYQFKYPEFPASEIGTRLYGGSERILIVAAFTDDDELYLYGPDLTLVTSIPFGSGSTASDTVIAVTSNQEDTFYLLYNPSGIVTEQYVLRMSDAGVINPTVIGPLTSTGPNTGGSIAVSPDETILYYQCTGNNLGAIHRWNLTTNSAMSDLVASPGAGYFAIGNGALVVLPSGNVIGGFDQFLSGSNGFLRMYNSSGVQQWSYDTGVLAIDYHGAKVSFGADYPDSVWLIVHFINGHSRFIDLDVSTGTALSSFDVATYFTGAYEPSESATPESRFGPAPSCVYISLPESVDIGNLIDCPHGSFNPYVQKSGSYRQTMLRGQGSFDASITGAGSFRTSMRSVKGTYESSLPTQTGSF